MKEMTAFLLMIMAMLFVFVMGCVMDPNPEFGDMTDERDGQTYKTVTLGDQTWLAQNLNYETENSWCYDDDPVNCETFGRLYDWEAAMNACPDGWHLASDEEWSTLIKYLDPKADPDAGLEESEVAGGMMKATGTIEDGTGLWKSPNKDATDVSGFSAVPSGTRFPTGSFKQLGQHVMFWTSTEYETDNAWTRMLDYNQGGIFKDNTAITKDYGVAVRCIMDKYTVVCDPDTDLCWQDPQREAFNYDDQGVRAFEADQYCDELVLGGFDDWRVPTIMELRSITAGFEGTETGGACPIVDGDITYAEAQNVNCFNIAVDATGNGPSDNGCYLKPGFTGTCEKPDPYSAGHPLEHVAYETPSDTVKWRAVLMFENGSVLFNHACTGVDVRCVRDDDGSPIVDCVEEEACTPGETKSCECAGFGDRPDGIQTCNQAGDCWGPCECTKSIIDTSVNPECNRGNEFYDQADILTVNISLPEGDTIDYDPAVVSVFLYKCPDENTDMPSRPPDGGSWENQVVDPGPPPYSMEVRGITYYREELIEGRHCLILQMSQKILMPPIPEAGDYFYWDPSQGIVFPLEGGAETVDVTLERIGG